RTLEDNERRYRRNRQLWESRFEGRTDEGLLQRESGGMQLLDHLLRPFVEVDVIDVWSVQSSSNKSPPSRCNRFAHRLQEYSRILEMFENLDTDQPFAWIDFVLHDILQDDV